MGGSEKNVLPTHVSIDGEMKKRVVVKTKADAPAQSENVRPKTVVKAMETECALKVCCEMYSRCTIKMTNSWLNCRLMLSKAALTPPEYLETTLGPPEEVKLRCVKPQSNHPPLWTGNWPTPVKRNLSSMSRIFQSSRKRRSRNLGVCW
jgi:hypothetical protein